MCVFVVKPVKFIRNNGCLARNELHVAFKGYHILIYKYIFEIVLLFGHCITLYNIVCVGYYQSCINQSQFSHNFPKSYALQDAPINIEKDYANSVVNNDIDRTPAVDVFGRRTGRDSYFF